MFYCAQKVVLHPVPPLYNVDQQEVSVACPLCSSEYPCVVKLVFVTVIFVCFLLQLTDACQKALIRIFKVRGQNIHLLYAH